MKKQKEDAGIEISRFLARLDSLSENEIKLFRYFLEFIEKKGYFLAKKEDSIPVSIFKNDLLTIFFLVYYNISTNK